VATPIRFVRLRVIGLLFSGAALGACLRFADTKLPLVVLAVLLTTNDFRVVGLAAVVGSLAVRPAHVSALSNSAAVEA
jgi:hypothetical protein